MVGGIIYAVARDITERKDWELALTRSEEKYRQIIDTTLEGVCLVDVDGKTSFVNQRLLEMLGYPESAIVGKSLLEFIIPDAKLNLPEYDQQHHPWQFRCQDGSKVWTIVSTTNIHDEYGNYSGCIHLFTNITQLAEIQEALNSSKNQLSSVLNSSLDGIMAFEAIRDEQGKIIDFEWLLTNPTACTFVGKSESELIGYRLLEIMPGNASEGLFAKYVEVVESGKPLQTEFYYQHEGIDAWFEIIAVKLNNGFAVTFSNVTEIKESQKALQQANQQLEKQIDTLKQRNQEMLLLSEMSDFLQTCLTVEEACVAIAGLIQPLFPGCGGSIFLRNSASNQIEKIVSWGKDFNQQDSFTVENCWGLRRGRSHWVDQKRLKLCCHHLDSLDSLAGSLCLPLLALGKTLGLLYLSAEQEELLSPNKQQLARMVSEQIASVIANLQLRATLEYQSIRDPLTGLYNRRYLDISLPKAIQLAQQQHQPVGIIMVDIDYFRSINNNYGHEGGDYVLQSVGKLLQDIGANTKTLVCRYGGEEITLILSGFNLAQTSNLAETIRQSMANLRVDYNGREISFTASLGVACFPDHGYSGTDVLREADKALLYAKENGRNQVVIAL